MFILIGIKKELCQKLKPGKIQYSYIMNKLRENIPVLMLNIYPSLKLIAGNGR